MVGEERCWRLSEGSGALLLCNRLYRRFLWVYSYFWFLWLCNFRFVLIFGGTRLLFLALLGF